ncbi:MAG: hypothetical protein EOO05_09675 [Chitinophagaceae bacterium]|nr:MAG: hypothetical protein EOO05_09675 [Chitinophagaceae bacterium]
MSLKDGNPEGIIIYDSKYGATRQYAEWLGEMTHLPVMQYNRLTVGILELYPLVIIGTPVYIGRFRIKSWLTKAAGALRDKKLVFFIVCASGPGEEEQRQKYIRTSISPELAHRAVFHFLPGRLIHRSLSARDKLMMIIGSALEKNPDRRKAMRSDMDQVIKSNLESISVSIANAITAVRGRP